METHNTTTQPVALRIPADLLERVDRHQERLRASVEGLRVTRSDAVRALLAAGLDAAENGGPRQ